MEKNNTGVFQNALIWGLILGIVYSIYQLLLFFADLNTNKTFGSISYIIIIALIIISTKYYRDKVLNGTISYSRALGFGVMTTLVASIIIAIYTYLFTTVIDPNAIEKMLLAIEEELIKQNMSDDQIEMVLNYQKMFLKPMILSILEVPGTTFTGFIIALITSIFLKKEPAISSFE